MLGKGKQSEQQKHGGKLLLCKVKEIMYFKSHKLPGQTIERDQVTVKIL